MPKKGWQFKPPALYFKFTNQTLAFLFALSYKVTSNHALDEPSALRLLAPRSNVWASSLCFLYKSLTVFLFPSA